MPESFTADLRDDMRHAFSQSLLAMPHVETLLQKLRGTALPGIVRAISSACNFSLNLGGALPLLRKSHLHGGHGQLMPNRHRISFCWRPRRCGARPGRSLVIEDSISGVEAGKAAG